MKELQEDFNLLTAGKLLYKRRKALGYKYDDIADAIKIRTGYLKLLEQDKFDKFPSDTYAKGFLKLYAKFLGLNTEKVMALYRRQMEEKKSELSPVEGKLSSPKIIITTNILGIVVIILAIGAILAYIYWQYHVYNSPPPLDIVSPQDGLETAESEIEVRGCTTTNAIVEVNNSAVRLDDNGCFAENILIEDGKNVITISAYKKDNNRKRTEKKLVITRIDQSDENEQSNDDNNETDVQQITAQVTVHDGEAWVRIEVDGETEYEQILESGFNETFTADESFYIQTGRVTTVTVTVDDEEKEFQIEDGGVGVISCRIHSNVVECN